MARLNRRLIADPNVKAILFMGVRLHFAFLRLIPAALFFSIQSETLSTNLCNPIGILSGDSSCVHYRG